MTEEVIIEQKRKLKEDSESKSKVIDYLDSIKILLDEEDADIAVQYALWLYTKTNMRLNPQIEKDFPLFSKGVYYGNLGKGVGAEVEKDRPFVLLSGSNISETVIIIPISDDEKYIDSTFWYHVPLSTGDTALVEQIRTISKTRIRRPIREGRKVRALLDGELQKINDAIDRLKFYIKK